MKIFYVTGCMFITYILIIKLRTVNNSSQPAHGGLLNAVDACIFFCKQYLEN